jgi:dUTP pyrophosphatase
MRVKIKKLHSDAIIPKYQTSGSAGFDIHVIEDVEIYPGETKILKTGLSFEIPEGYELQIVPRSGISAKSKLRISNSPGTVDSDFRGEIGIIVDNIDYLKKDSIPHTIKKGDRIAQGKITPVVQAIFIETDELDQTVRGEGRFGSTGIGDLNTSSNNTFYIDPKFITTTNIADGKINITA